MKPTTISKQANRKSFAPTLIVKPRIWQDFARSSFWSLSDRSVNISGGAREYEKIVWPKSLRD